MKPTITMMVIPRKSVHEFISNGHSNCSSNIDDETKTNFKFREIKPRQTN